MSTLYPLHKLLEAADRIEVVGCLCELVSFHEPGSVNEPVMLNQVFGGDTHYFDADQLVDITKPIMVDELHLPPGHQGRQLKEIKLFMFRPMTLDDVTA